MNETFKLIFEYSSINQDTFRWLQKKMCCLPCFSFFPRDNIKFSEYKQYVWSKFRNQISNFGIIIAWPADFSPPGMAGGMAYKLCTFLFEISL